MKITYDPVADILFLQRVVPNAQQKVSEIEEGVLVRTNTESGIVEAYEIQGFRARSASGLSLSLPDAVRARALRSV